MPPDCSDCKRPPARVPGSHGNASARKTRWRLESREIVPCAAERLRRIIAAAISQPRRDLQIRSLGVTVRALVTRRSLPWPRSGRPRSQLREPRAAVEHFAHLKYRQGWNKSEMI